MKIRTTLAILALCTFTGCATTPGAATGPAIAADEGVTVTSKLALRGSNDRVLLSTTPDMIEYVAADVGKVVLNLYRDGGSTAVQTATLLLDDNGATAGGRSQLGDDITFKKLGYQASYKIVATAFYKDDLTRQIDNTLNGDATSIATCTTTFTTGVNPDVQIDPIAVQLRKQEFSGTSNKTELDIKDGEVSDITGPEAIDVTAPVI